MAKKQKKDAFRLLTRVMVVVLVLAIVCGTGYVLLDKYAKGKLEEMILATQEKNAKMIEDYNAAVQAQRQREQQGENVQWPAAAQQGWDVLDVSAFELTNPTPVSATRQELIMGGMMLVNYWHSIPGDMPEDQMVSVIFGSERRLAAKDASVKLFPAALTALDRMLAAAKADGIENYIIEEAFRKMETQQASWDKEAALTKYSRYAGTALEDMVNKVVSKPGTSEYQSGLSCCILRYLSGDSEFNKAFAGTEHSEWLLDNSWKYGYVFRFPVTGYPRADTIDKSYITGRTNRMSVYRYVGEANAAVMHAKDMCMEEYVEYLVAHPHLAVYQDGALKYEIVRVPYTTGVNIDTYINSTCVSYQLSMDNVGGVVVAMTY